MNIGLRRRRVIPINRLLYLFGQQLPYLAIVWFLFRASPEKRLKILNILEDMVKHLDSLKNDKNSLHIELAVRIADWEKDQRD